jgi:hypothetical protein
MKNMFYRLTNAISAFWIVFTNPSICSIGNLNSLVGLYEMIFKTVQEQRPFMSRIGVLNVDTGDRHEIATLWCGCGLGVNPTDRITELNKEVSSLKTENALLLGKIEQLKGKADE